MFGLNKVKNYFSNRKKKEFYALVGEKAFERTGTGIIEPILNASGSSGLLVTISKRLGLRNGDVTSKDYEEAEYDLGEIDLAYNSDSYVRQGLDKYLEQCFKEGYDFYGENPSTVEYIELRLLFIAEATKTPTHQLISSIAEDVVKYSNCIILKARKQDDTQLPPTTTVNGLDGKEPIVGYFPAHPATFKVKRDRVGTVQGWQQEVEGGDKAIKFRAEDVIHIPYKRKKGDAFGQPFLFPVINDIKALRFMEENVVNMVYKHVNPFIHVRVGDNEAPGTKQEVDEVESTLSNMNPEDGFVSTNRVEVRNIATNNAIDARPYLEYMEARVFSGIGVPGIAFGRGGTANRNTADALTAEMADRIRAIQTVIEDYVNHEIIKELLQEGGFDPLTNPQDMVFFKFRENDLDKKIKFENHQTFLFEHNVITENELRDAIDKDPITERNMLYHELYTMTTLNAKAQQSGASKGETDNKNKPTNQHGTKPSSKKNTNFKTEFLNMSILDIKEKYSLSEKSATIVHEYAKNINTSSVEVFTYRIEKIIKTVREF